MSIRLCERSLAGNPDISDIPAQRLLRFCRDGLPPNKILFAGHDPSRFVAACLREEVRAACKQKSRKDTPAPRKGFHR